MRHWECDDVQFASSDFHPAQAVEIFLKRLVVFRCAILFNDSYNRSLGYKPREIIDVTVGVIAGDAIAEPENLADAEIIAQALLDVITGKIGIPIFVQEARFTGE